jgi:hypothetical protein
VVHSVSLVFKSIDRKEIGYRALLCKTGATYLYKMPCQGVLGSDFATEHAVFTPALRTEYPRLTPAATIDELLLDDLV